MKHKVIHIAPSIIGGVHSFLRNLALYTIESYDVTILSLGKCTDFDSDFCSMVNVQRLSVHNVWSFRTLSILYTNIKSHDIIHVHLFPAFYLCAFFKFLFSNKRFIYTEHASYNNRRNYRLLKYVERFIYRCYDHVVAISPSCKRNLETWLCNKMHVDLINNGIIIDKSGVLPFNYSILGITARYVIVMVARLSKDKDFNTLIHAMQFLSDDYHLVLVGEGDQRLLIETQISTLNLQDRITLCGLRSDVLNLLSGASVSVLSSYGEGLGLSILESLSVHTPCIGSDVAGICDILPESYRFPLGNEQALASLIKKVSKGEIEPLHYEDILANYTIECMSSSYLSLYGECL